MFHVPNAVSLSLPGVIHITPILAPDARGFFAEIFSVEYLSSLGIYDSFTQTSVSFSRKHVLRGLHFQIAPHEQAKLVRCSSGTIFDVVVDVRPDSAQYGKYVTVELSGERQDVLYIPPGYAHGFCALSDAVVEYRLSHDFVPTHALGVRYDDPVLGIEWPVAHPILSEKDRSWPLLPPV